MVFRLPEVFRLVVVFRQEVFHLGRPGGDVPPAVGVPPDVGVPPGDVPPDFEAAFVRLALLRRNRLLFCDNSSLPIART